MIKSTKLALIDFDGTIFSSSEFFDFLKINFKESIFLSEEIFDRALGELRKTEDNYNHLKHINIIKTFDNNFDVNAAKNVAEASFRKAENFLYPGAKDFLQSLKNESWNLIMITCGDYSWQKKKIDKSGVKNFFKKIIIARNALGKTEEIRIFFKKRHFLLPGDDVFFVDNRAEVLEETKKVLPEINCVQVRHEHFGDNNGRVARSNVAELSRSLSEVLEIMR